MFSRRFFFFFAGEGLEGGEYWSNRSLDSFGVGRVTGSEGFFLGATTWKAEVPLEPGRPTGGRSRRPGEEAVRGIAAARGERPKVGVLGEEAAEVTGLE